MSLVILFHFVCTQHVLDINISIIRFEQCPCCRLQLETRTLLKPSRTKSSTHNEPGKKDRCGNSTAVSQAPDDGYINVRNILST